MYILHNRRDSAQVHRVYDSICGIISTEVGRGSVWENSSVHLLDGHGIPEDEVPFFIFAGAVLEWSTDYSSGSIGDRYEQDTERDTTTLPRLRMWRAGDSVNLWAVSCAFVSLTEGRYSVQVRIRAARGRLAELLPPELKSRTRELRGVIFGGGKESLSSFYLCDSIVKGLNDRSVDSFVYPEEMMGNIYPLRLFNSRWRMQTLSASYIEYAADTMDAEDGAPQPGPGNLAFRYGAFYIRGMGFVLNSTETPLLRDRPTVYFTRVFEVKPIEEVDCEWEE